MDELRAGAKLSLAVLPPSPVFLQSDEAAFDYPTFGHHLEAMQIATRGDLHSHVLTQHLLYALLEELPYIAAVA